MTTTSTTSAPTINSSLSSIPVIGKSLAGLETSVAADGLNLIAILLGLIFVIAGLFMFKPVKQTVVSGAKLASKGAALAA